MPGWSDWDPAARGLLAQALQNNATLVALYGVLASPSAGAGASPSASAGIIAGDGTSASTKPISSASTGAGPSVSVRLSTRTEFLLALGSLRVPIFKPPPVHPPASAPPQETQKQTQPQAPSSDNRNIINNHDDNININIITNNPDHITASTSTPNDVFDGRSRAIYRHLCVTLLALLPPARGPGLDPGPGHASGPGLGRTGASPCPRRVYASLVLALWGTYYRPASAKDGLLRALLYHNGAR